MDTRRRNNFIRARRFVAIVALWVLSTVNVLAETSKTLRPCNGIISKVRRAGVPIYSEPDLSSKVICRIEPRVKICVVGQQSEFAILQNTIELSAEAKAELPTLLFVRDVEVLRDVQALRTSATGNLDIDQIQAAKNFYYSIQSGVVPEDGLLPYRPVLELFGVSGFVPQAGENNSDVRPNSPMQEPLPTITPTPAESEECPERCEVSQSDENSSPIKNH